jgi:RNA polymerase sigma-70 factor (ECF subfamily)
MRAFFGLVCLQIRRELIDMARAGKRGPRPGPIGGGDSSESPGVDAPDDFSTTQEGRQTDILEAVEKLPEDQREVVDLLFWMGLTQPEAAQIIGVHEDTVKRRWAAARVKLQGFLKAYGPAK